MCIDMKRGKGQVQIQIDETGECKYLGIFIRLQGKMFGKNALEIIKKAQ